MIFVRVAGATLAPSVKARDTAEIDTPARSATCLAVMLRLEDLLSTGGMDVHDDFDLSSVHTINANIFAHLSVRKQTVNHQDSLV
jgi:hypothetical protein